MSSFSAARKAADAFTVETSFSTSTSAPWTGPVRDDDIQLKIAASRMAGRRNASAMTEEDIAKLLRERSELLDRKFGEGLSRVEEHQLAYVRWQLERLDDARYGESLDRLEASVVRYEGLCSELKSFRDELQQAREANNER